MKQSFYQKVGELRKQLKACVSRKQMRRVVQSLNIDLFVSYNTNSFFSFTENMNTNCPSGSLSFAIYTKISDGNNQVVGRPATFYINSPSFSKMELEKLYVKTILSTLNYLNLE